ncbi:MAG: type IV pilus assembly protein PilO [Lysobacterales bacterium]|jgi:type IV pilus assembly protein PilO
MFQEFQDIDWADIGGAPVSVRYVLLSALLIALVVAGYYLQISEKWDELDLVKEQEFALRSEFETKQQKAANLEKYEVQLVEMQDLLQIMFRQLPGKTEMDKLLVDVSQTALAAGIDVQLFEPMTEELKDFYAERPINIRMLGDFHEFGEFVSGVAKLPRVVILTMHDISLRRAVGQFAGRLILEGQVKTYRNVDDEEAAQLEAGAAP